MGQVLIPTVALCLFPGQYESWLSVVLCLLGDLDNYLGDLD